MTKGEREGERDKKGGHECSFFDRESERITVQYKKKSARRRSQMNDVRGGGEILWRGRI